MYFHIIREINKKKKKNQALKKIFHFSESSLCFSIRTLSFLSSWKYKVSNYLLFPPSASPARLMSPAQCIPIRNTNKTCQVFIKTPGAPVPLFLIISFTFFTIFHHNISFRINMLFLTFNLFKFTWNSHFCVFFLLCFSPT